MPELMDILKRFAGGYGRFWHYTATHDMAIIFFRRKRDDGQELGWLRLGGCEYVCLPAGFRVEDLEVDTTPEGEQRLHGGRVDVVFKDWRFDDRLPRL